MSEDWLGTEDEQKALVPAEVQLPAAYAERVALVEDCWSRLTLAQRTFLTALRENRFNARAANRAVHGASYTNTSHTKWKSEPDYATVLRVWRAIASEGALDKDRLLARQDDIVETLLTPKPVLWQGVPVRDLRDPRGMTVLEEVEAGAASRANEVLMKAAGLLKDKEIDITVGVVVGGPPTLNIQVMPTRPSATVQQERVTIDAKFTEMPSDDWLGA